MAFTFLEDAPVGVTFLDDEPTTGVTFLDEPVESVAPTPQSPTPSFTATMPVKIGQPIGAPQDFVTFDPNTLLTAPARSEPTQSVDTGDYKISYAKAAPTNAVPALNPINGEWTPEVIASQNARADEFNPPTESALRERSYNEALTPFFQESQGPRRLTEAEWWASQTPRVEAFEPKTFTGEIGKGNIPGAIGVAYKAARESLTGILPPTEEQILNESVPWGTNPDGSVKYEYKPLGSRLDKTGIMTPLLETQMMSPEAGDSTMGAVGKSTFNFMAGLVNFGLSPLGIATVGLGAGTGAATRAAGFAPAGLGAEGSVAAQTAARLAATARVVSGGFAIDMASAVPEQYKAATESPTLQGRIEGWLGTVSSLGFAALAAKHAAKKPLELAERQTIESVVEFAKRTPDAVLEAVARNMEVDVYSRNLAIAELQRRQTERQAALAPEAAAAAEAAGTALPPSRVGSASPASPEYQYESKASQDWWEKQDALIAKRDAIQADESTIGSPERKSIRDELEAHGDLIYTEEGRALGLGKRRINKNNPLEKVNVTGSQYDTIGQADITGWKFDGEWKTSESGKQFRRVISPNGKDRGVVWKDTLHPLENAALEKNNSNTSVAQPVLPSGTTEPPDPAATAVGVIKTAAAADAAGKPFSPRIEEPGTPTPYGRETDVYDITTGLQRKPAPAAKAGEGGVALTPEESAALRITLLKGVENRGDGIFFVPEKLMTPARRKELQRGGNAVQVKPWADVTGVPSDRGYAILDRRERIASRATKPTPAAPAALEVAPPVAPKPESVVSPTVGTPIVGVGGSVISELQISRATYGAEIYNSMRAKDGTPPTRAEWERAMAGEYPEIIEGGGAILTKTWQTSKAAAESFNANKGRKSMTDEATQVITGAIEGSGVPSRITNADQAASARQDMLPPAQRTIGPSTNLELMADVKREMQDNPYLMTELLNRVTADPRSKTSDREQAMLINYGNILRNQADALFESQKEAAKSGDKTLLRELAKEEEKLLERKKDFMQITVDSGSEAGKTLQARQIALAEDFTLLNRVVIEEIAKGSKLTREERAKVEKETSAHEKLTKAVAERDKAIAETAEQKYRANELEKLLSESGKKPAETVTKGRLPVDYAPKKPFGENVIAYADAKAAEALARIKAKIGGQLGSAPDPTILADAAIYGAAKLTKGSVKFTQWSLEMAAEVGNWIKPYAKELWEQSKVQVESMMSEAPRDIVAEREATLAGLKEATEANLPKSKLYGYARALAKQFIDEGMTKMGDIDAAVHAELQKVIPEITVRESGTAWTGYGEWKPASIEPASVTLANVTGERRAALKLEGVRDLDPPEARRNTGQGRQPPTAQTRMTEKEAARIEKQKNLKSVDPEKAHKTALESVKNNLRNRLEELKLAMATRKRINRDKIGVERDAEAKDLQDQLDVAQKDYDQVFPKEPITIDEQLRRSAVIAERNAAEWEKRTSDAKKGIFKTSEKSDAPINQRIQAANDQAAAYRAEATRLRDLDSSISEAKTQAKLDLAGERLGDILDNGEKTKPSAKQGPVTAATSAKQARNAALRKAIEDSRDLSGETAAKRAEAIGRALDKEIAKVSNELETNTRRAAATGKVDTVGNEQKRSELAAMRDFRKELDKVTGKTIDEKTLDSLIKRRDVLQREVDSGKIDPKTGRPTANTAEQAKIQGEIDALNARKAQIRKTANPKTPENIRELQRIQDRLDSAKDRLARGQIEPETGKPTVRDKAQTDALAELKTINDTIAQMRRAAAPSLSPAMKNLRAERARIIRSIADKTLRIYGQEFEPRARPVKPVPFTPQEKALAEANMADRVELNRIENRLHQAAFDHALKNRTLPQKVAGLLLELYQLTRVTALSYDFSNPLRQGKMIIFDRMWSKSGRKDIASAFAAMFKATGVTPTGLKAAFKSYQDYALAGNKKRGFVEASRTIAEYGERFETAVNLEISQRPDAPLYKAWGLDLTAWSDSSAKSKIQEGFESRWKRYIPGVGASGRAASAFTNRLMADAASARIALLAKDGMVTPRQGQIIMQEINISVGRATLGKPGGNLDRRSRATASGLAYLFLAPRFAVSRFMALYGHSFWRAALTGEGTVAKIIAAQYARYIAGLAVNYTLISLMQDKDDPMIGMNPLDKSTFGTIRIGDTRYDPLSGLRQAAVISSQLIARKKIAGSGREIDLTAEKKKNQFDDDLGDVLGTFFRSKLNIVPATAYDIWSGTDLSGKPVQALPSGTPFTEDFEPGELLTMPMPLSLEQTYEALRAQRLDKGMVLSILGILGDSVNTYSDERNKSR